MDQPGAHRITSLFGKVRLAGAQKYPRCYAWVLCEQALEVIVLKSGEILLNTDSTLPWTAYSARDNLLPDKKRALAGTSPLYLLFRRDNVKQEYH